jgi:hypothetical protein
MGRRVFGAVGVTAVEELGAAGPLAASGEAPPATGRAFGGSAATELPRFATLALGPEEPQPAASATARSSAATVTPAAQFRRRDPDIRRLWARKGRIRHRSVQLRAELQEFGWRAVRRPAE